MNGPLHSIHVAECASAACPLPLRMAMSFAARMAGGLGASVTKLVDPAGDPVRSIEPIVGSASALSIFLDAGKTVTALAPGQTQADGLAALPKPADIVLCDAAAHAQLPPRLASRVRTVFSVFPHGIDCPPDAAASEFTIMASTGLLDLVGDPQREPLRMGGHQLAFSCGLAGYGGAIAALCRPGANGQPETVRVSLADVAVWINWKSVAMPSWAPSGRARLGQDAEWQVVRCADGWVALVFLEADWPVLREFVNDPRLFEPRFDDRAERRAHARMLSQWIEQAFLRYTRREIKDIALARRLPLGPVWTPVELETDPQNLARGFLCRQAMPDGPPVLMPRLPVLWNQRAFGAAMVAQA